MLRKFHFLLLLLLASITIHAQAQSLDGPTPRIIGGQPATSGDYPWAVALLRSNVVSAYSAQFCGGTLIGDRWVLTAAHCVDNFSSPSQVEVAIGVANLSGITSNDRISLNNIIVHPDYDVFSKNNDIALLELSTPSNAPVLDVATNTLTNSIPNDGGVSGTDLMTIIGWGTTNADPLFFNRPSQLQETEVPLFDFADCDAIYDRPGVVGDELTSNMICAGYSAGGQDTCQGDSGGPILYFNNGNWYQTGITSFGNGCAAANNPGVYTRAANYLTWIAEATAISFPSQHRFGFHGIGRFTSETLTLGNYSGASITVNSVQLTGPNVFSIANQTCNDNVIPDGGNCTITLNFLAAGAGTQLATLSVDMGANGILNNAISGIGLNSVGADALDESPSRTWYSGGDASWFSTSVTNSNNNTAMRSGNIGHNQSSALLAYFTGPGIHSFRWGASTEHSYDYLKLYIDGVLVDAISGEQNWEQRDISLSLGSHRVTWVYEKDVRDTGGQDTVWLDSVNSTYSGGTSIGGGPTTTTTRGFGGGGGSFDIAWLLLLIVMLGLKTLHSNYYPRKNHA